jgi:hypothetical protein
MTTAAGKRAVTFLAQRGHYRKAQAVAGQLNQLGGELAGFGVLDQQLFHVVSFRFLIIDGFGRSPSLASS